MDGASSRSFPRAAGFRRLASAGLVWAYNPSETAGGAGMAKTKQFTISIDNHPGAVAEIARTLGSAKVNILSLLGTSQGTGGTVQHLLDDTRLAQQALDSARISYQRSEER